MYRKVTQTKSQNIISALQQQYSISGIKPPKGVTELLVKFVIGAGSKDNFFGPDTFMTRNIRTSPLLSFHFDNFREQNGGKHDSNKYAWETGKKQPRFELSNADDEYLNILNAPRQFVESFNIEISEIIDDTGNPTSWGTLFAESAFTYFELKHPWFFQSFERQKWNESYLMSSCTPTTTLATVNQYFIGKRTT